MKRATAGLPVATFPAIIQPYLRNGLASMSTSNHAISASGFIAQADACVAVAKKSKKQPLI
ncbi:hypothetical protein PRJ_3270 [Pseudomonas sp. XWY-1]|nr:hypothetical protein PRJ_3270 [Pseudomonas sp. XWY-1]PJX11063.1 hypothetical protein CQW32_08595 [Pseudomonas putida]